MGGENHAKTLRYVKLSTRNSTGEQITRDWTTKVKLAQQGVCFMQQSRLITESGNTQKV